MRYNTVSELQKIINTLEEINDVTAGKYGEDAYDKVNEAIEAVRNACTYIYTKYEKVNSSRKPTKSLKHILKSGYYNDPVNHPDGGGTCDCCGAHCDGGDYYLSELHWRDESVVQALYEAFGGNPYYDMWDEDKLMRWLQEADEDVDEYYMDSMFNEVGDYVFEHGEMLCSDCYRERLKEAAEKWVEENW